MKDVTSTSFGLLIAYLLPGLAGFFCTIFWLPETKTVFHRFLGADENVGLFLLVILGSLICGLQVSIFRWLFYEKIFRGKVSFNEKDFDKLGDKDKLESFRAAVDEHYRYHQFWGGMSLIIPIAYFGSTNFILNQFPACTTFQYFIFFTILEFPTILAARDSFKKYIQRATKILKG